VAAGRRFLDDALGVGLLFEVSPFDYLSSRQLEVARLMVQGKRTGDIALELRLTESTVRTVRTTVMAKLRVRSDIALVRLAMVWGLIPVSGDAEVEGSQRG
jgi:two-component system invasion response regulator UvrY